MLQLKSRNPVNRGKSNLVYYRVEFADERVPGDLIGTEVTVVDSRNRRETVGKIHGVENSKEHKGGIPAGERVVIAIWPQGKPIPSKPVRASRS